MFTRCKHCGWPFFVNQKAVSYWLPSVTFPVHKVCKKAYERSMREYCQAIDQDCNDCKRFQRGKWLSKGVCQGTCGKTGEPTEARPKQYSGRECFEPRN